MNARFRGTIYIGARMSELEPTRPAAGFERPWVQSLVLPSICADDRQDGNLGLELLTVPKIRTARLNAIEPRTISLALKKPRVKTYSHAFTAAGAGVFHQPVEQKAARPAAAAPPSSPRAPEDSPERYTRIRPPKDIVKLEDRLFYVLQPPIESWMSGAQMEFPFKPFPYQFEGIAFLYPRYAALLADEMGLGKTMQTITAIRLLLRSGEMRQILLICPKPLVNNWQREFSTWAPEIPLLAIEGDQTKRRWQWQTDMPVKIANYEILLRDRDVLTDPSLEFDLVVLDEAQRIKNKAGTTSQIARAIRRKRSWALTGTPVENRAEDLVGIFEFLAPGYLCPQMKPRQMGQLAGEFVLRRTKDKVLTDLPPKMYRDAHIELSPEQRESYRMAEEDGVLRLEKLGREITIQHVFELVLRLKQICNFDPLTGESAKLERLSADLEEVAESGKKAIIFSQWVHTIEELTKRLSIYKPLEYHGRIPHKDRPGVLDRFKEDPKRNVLLLSYGAGGVGLNLQFSQYVFLFDRWWNPALEDQAINRAHRIGAAGPVTVTRFLAVSTIEERIDQILADKRELFDTILNSADPQKNLGLSKAEVFGLFKLKCPAGPIDPSKV